MHDPHVVWYTQFVIRDAAFDGVFIEIDGA
jgi:hypothetical protein